jgi:hypothetical protein
MARSVTGLFATREQVDSLDGALRTAGLEPERITIVAPGGQVVRVPGPSEVRQGLGTWLAKRLHRHERAQDQVQTYPDTIAHEGRWLVSADIRSDGEEADARNLMVTAGAEQISSAIDGTMVAVGAR